MATLIVRHCSRYEIPLALAELHNLISSVAAEKRFERLGKTFTETKQPG